jgi:hypothetical protein
VDYNLDWFRQHVSDADVALKTMAEAHLRSVAKEAFPGRSNLTVKFSKRDELLRKRVVNRVQTLDGPIVKTWGSSGL